MTHEEWVRTELDRWSRLLGFRYTPREEIEQRLRKVRREMARQQLEALLVVQKMDYFYLSGTTQDSLLFVPLEGDPMLMVKRELERARVDSPLDRVVGFRSVRDLPALIRNHLGQLPETMGLEFDVLPVRDYQRYVELFPGSRLMDSSSVFRHARKIKTPFEVEMMRRAGEITREVFEEARTIVEGLNCTHCVFRANHASNYLPIGGTLPGDKENILHRIDGILAKKDVSFKPEWLRAL